MRSRHWFLKSPKRKSKRSSNNTTNNKKPDLPAGLLTPPEDYHAGGNRTNERTKQRIPTNTKPDTTSTNQTKQASARRHVPSVRRGVPYPGHDVRQVRDRFEGMDPRLSVMDPSPARVPGFDGALRRPPAWTCQPAVRAHADQTLGR